MPVKKPAKPPKSSRPKSKTVSKRTSPPAHSPHRSSKAEPVAQRPPSFWASLPPERKLDIVGVGLALLGLLTLLSLFSANRSLLTGGWVRLLAGLVGWGIYILPAALLAVGIWLVARNVERIPAPTIERGTGLLLTFFWLLTTFHAFAGPPEQASEVAAAGQGGGLIGSLLYRLLWGGLGTGAAIIALLAWLTIALILTFDISTQDLITFFRPLGNGLRTLFHKAVHPPTPGLRGESEPQLPPTFTPLQRPPFQPLQTSGPGIPPPAPGSAAPIRWTLPAVKEILDAGAAPSINEEFIEQRARLIEETLASFGAPAHVVEINRGPAVTQFGIEPDFIETRSGRTRVRVSRIVSLADDLALALAAPRIRIQAPVPGRSYVGIEVPNTEMTLVALRDIIESEVFQRVKSPLRIALGRDVAGYPCVADLTAMPHLLIAGTTGSGKSVCVNAILTCLLLQNTPDDLRLILVDPKRVELTGYNGIPHLLAPVVVEMERVIGALQWMSREMDKRYHLFSSIGARNIVDYNARMSLQGSKKLPYLVVVIDELADLMMIAPDETERTITRLAQLARATGIHIILATQRPSVDVVTGLIKANFPARIAFAVASGVDSRVILDQPGAERLLGRGDMLYQAPDAPAPVRLQGVFVSDHEIQRLVETWRQQTLSASIYAVPGGMTGTADIPPASGNLPLRQTPLWDDMLPMEQADPLLQEAVDLVRREGRASVSMLQRKLRIGYTRAARLIDTLEEKGIVGPPEGQTQVRQVLDYGPAAPPKDSA